MFLTPLLVPSVYWLVQSFDDSRLFHALNYFHLDATIRAIQRYREKGHAYLVLSLIKYQLQNSTSKIRYLTKPLPDWYFSLHNLQHHAKLMCNLPHSTESFLGQHIPVLAHSCSLEILMVCVLKGLKIFS